MKKTILVIATLAGISGLLSACGTPVKSTPESEQRSLNHVEQVNKNR